MLDPTPLESLSLAPGNNISIDPGNTGCGWVVWADVAPQRELVLISHGRDHNILLRKTIARWTRQGMSQQCQLQIETPKPRGMPTAAEEMETLIQIGRILQMWPGKWSYVFRQEVKMHLCGSMIAKDRNVSQAIRDRFGGDSVSVGNKKCPNCKGKGWRGAGRPECLDCGGSGWLHPPGILAGVADHEWAALAVALRWHDLGEEVVQRIVGVQKASSKKWNKKAKVSKGVPT